MLELPNEMIREIIKNIDYDSIINIRKTCKYFNKYKHYPKFKYIIFFDRSGSYNIHDIKNIKNVSKYPNIDNLRFDYYRFNIKEKYNYYHNDDSEDSCECCEYDSLGFCINTITTDKNKSFKCINDKNKQIEFKINNSTFIININ